MSSSIPTPVEETAPKPSQTKTSGSWDWNPEKRLVANLKEIAGQMRIFEHCASPDGEQIASAVEKEQGEDKFSLFVNDKAWEGEFEKAWSLAFTPTGKLMALIRVDDEWTVGVDGELWSERYEFAWNPKMSADGIAVQTKQDAKYSLALNGKSWPEPFLSIRDYSLSADGTRMAATVQVEELGEADIFKFLEGTWGIAVDGTALPSRFLNTYAPIFSSDGKHVAVEVRTDICEYTILQDGEPWNAHFSCVWEPRFRPSGQAGGAQRPTEALPDRDPKSCRLSVPVKKGGWTLVENGEALWKGSYIQLWRHIYSPDGNRIAAVVAPSFGRWTIAVDDVPWGVTFSDAVEPPVFSPDGRRVAAIVKDNDSYSIAVDGTPWSETFDMVWDPVFSPNGQQVAAKVKKNGRYALAVNGRTQGGGYEALWDPTWSPAGDRLLVRFVEDGNYFRHVMAA